MANHDKITMTNAKKIYRLNDTDLQELDLEIKTNPHKRSLAMYLYNKNDIINVFKQKYDLNSNYDVQQKIKEIEETKKERAEKRLMNSMNAKIMRKNELVERMKQYKLVIRNDSKLCKGYIDGTITEYSVDDIVKRMCQMKYLYDYADIQSAFSKAYEEYNDELNSGYIPDCTVFDNAERIALQKCGGYPSVFPWMV